MAFPEDADGVPFEILVEPDPPESGRYTLRVHVDVEGDGSVGRGDYVNVESVAIDRRGAPTDVPVRRLSS